MKTYTTVQGDTFDSIAYNELGDSALSGEIMKANPMYLSICKFSSGVELTIPDVVSSEVDETIPPWRRTDG